MDQRDSLHVGLLRMGVKARLPRGFQPEECIGTGKSLGIIEVDLGPVRWVNVRKIAADGVNEYRADLGVPDMRLSRFPEVGRISIYSRPGKNVSFRWDGDDQNLGIIEALNRDPLLRIELAPGGRHAPDGFTDWHEETGVVIRAHPDERCWTMSFSLETRLRIILGVFVGRRLRVPLSEEIAAYQQAGRVLLNSRLSSHWPNEPALLQRPGSAPA